MSYGFRTTLRGLGRAKGFTGITVLTLALGLGAATAVFNVVDWVLFRSAEYPPDMVMVGREMDNGQFVPSNPGVVLQHYESRTDLFAQSGRAAMIVGNVVVDGLPVSIGSIGVTENVLGLLDITPNLGRGFRPEEFNDGANNIVILTHSFWQRHFGGDSEILGKSILVNEAPCMVVGVLREDQRMPPQFKLGVLRPHQAVSDPARPWSPPYFFWARLQSGQTAESVRDALRDDPPELSPHLARALLSLPPAVQAMDAVSEWLRPSYYWMMLGAVGFLYSIACLNAANLIVVRRLGQARELAIRIALGANTRHIIGHSIIESLVLVGAGTVGALFVANAMLPLMLSFAGTNMLSSNPELWSLDGRAIAITLGLAGLTTILISAVPLFRILRVRPQSNLKESAGALGESRGLSRLRSGLVILQFAAALILITGTGLMVRTLQNLNAIEPGYSTDNRWKVALSLPRDTPRNIEGFLQQWEGLKTQIEQMPGVIKVGYGTDIILPGFAQSNGKIENADGDPIEITHYAMDEDFIAAGGLQLIRGRNIDPVTAQTETLINETLANLRWPDSNPIGQLIRPISARQLSPAEQDGLQVVGVIRDPKTSLQKDSMPAVYRHISLGPSNSQTLIVHVSAERSDAFGDDVRRQIYAFNSRIVIFNTITVEDQHNNAIAAENLALSVLQVLTVIAVVLTAVGIFALLAFSVSLRQGEFGVRLALGANARHLLTLVFTQGLRLTLIGTLIGLGGAWALVTTMESLLYGTSPHDPVVFTIAVVTLLLMSVSACIVPAIRATRVDIAKLLRSE